jgi:hypothetical protein
VILKTDTLNELSIRLLQNNIIRLHYFLIHKYGDIFIRDVSVFVLNFRNISQIYQMKLTYKKTIHKGLFYFFYAFASISTIVYLLFWIVFFMYKPQELSIILTITLFWVLSLAASYGGFHFFSLVVDVFTKSEH